MTVTIIEADAENREHYTIEVSPDEPDEVRRAFATIQDQVRNGLRGIPNRQQLLSWAERAKEEERRNLEKDLESRTLEFKRKFEDFQRDLKRTDAELTSTIVEELYGVVRDYGAKNTYSLVLEASSGALLYGDRALDVTDEIVKLYNASPKRTSSSKSAGGE